MRSRLAIRASVALMLLAGCAAQRGPSPAPVPADADAMRARFDTWIVAVREPELRFLEDPARDQKLLNAIDDAAHLVAMLRKTDLFRRVDFSERQGCAADLELVARPRTEAQRDIRPSWPWLLTGSLALETDSGLVFEAANAETGTFQWAHPELLVIGVFPILAGPVFLTGAVERWSYHQPSPEEDFAHWLLARGDALAAAAAHGPSEACAKAESDGPAEASPLPRPSP